MGILERAIGTLDIQGMTKEIMSVLTITDLDMYFVVQPRPAGFLQPEDYYEFIGVAYSERAAKLLSIQSSKQYPCKVLQLDMGKILALVEKLGGVKEVV